VFSWDLTGLQSKFSALSPLRSEFLAAPQAPNFSAPQARKFLGFWATAQKSIDFWDFGIFGDFGILGFLLSLHSVSCLRLFFEHSRAQAYFFESLSFLDFRIQRGDRLHLNTVASLQARKIFSV
jgi:hypothetical protein